MTAAETRSSLNRWRTARRLALGSIAVAGLVATSSSVLLMRNMMTERAPCPAAQTERAYTYSGIGVVFERDGEDFVVRRLFEDSPAQGKLFPGARFIAVDGESPETLDGWSEAIRGAPGTAVTLEVAYPCGGHRLIDIERQIIRVHY